MMEDQNELAMLSPARPHTSRLRDVLAVLFRQKRVVVLSFAGTLLGATVALLLMPSQYQAEMKILVKRERVEPLVTADDANQLRPVHTMTEQDVNSAVDLVKSRDLLAKVALTTGLVDPQEAAGDAQAQQQALGHAVAKLERDLEVEPPSKSNLISVQYHNHDPALAAKVLNQLGSLYLAKYVEVHRASGTPDFYKKETERYRQELEQVQQKLVQFNRDEGLVSADAEKAAALQKVSEFQAGLQQTQADLAETQQHIRTLVAQAKTMPSRVTTQVRTSSKVLGDLQSTLYALELKRTELLTKYTPDYRGVRDLDQQIAQAQEAVAQAQKTPLQEETTDEDPAYAWLRSELAKSRMESAGLQARASAMQRSIAGYQGQLRRLDQKSVEQDDLLRQVKQAQDNYQAAMERQQAARANQALDKEGIANVAIAEAAAVPYLPTSSPLVKLLLALVLAMAVGIGMAFVFDLLDPSFRTPDEVHALLGVPVLAAVPRTPYLLPPAPEDSAA